MNKDELCFHYCLSIAKAFKDGRSDVENNKYLSRNAMRLFPFSAAGFDYTDVWPIHPRFIAEFEKKHADANIAVNVLGVG